ncbi:MAG TPA: hypothetical protein VD704_09375 [Gaiellaceae bacterium]|nr:hypothetical protein [Gaiellaceae bacterium]
MRTLLGVFLAGSLLILTIGSGCAEESSTSGDDGTPAEESGGSSAGTPRERVQEALGDEVEASGYAGTLEVKNVAFENREAQVTLTTPEGGFEGANCGDMDDGAAAVFETIYNDGGWPRGALVVFQGGLVDTQTGEELPDENAAIYTMPPAQAQQIDWTNEDALLNIDWSNYRDFCHPAFDQ